MGDRLQTLLTNIEKRNEPTAKDICLADAILPNWQLKQSILTLYINNLNKAHSTNLLTLSKIAQINLIIKYDKELISKHTSLAAVKAMINDSNPTALLCLGEKRTFSKPKVDELMCTSRYDTWPDVGRYDAHWGGCETVMNADSFTFTYCAVLQDNTVITCTEKGCNF